MIVDVLVPLLILLPPVDWLVAVILSMAARRHPDVLTLRERAIAACLCAIVASIAGVLAWSRLGVVPLDSETALTFIAVALVLASVPSIYWLLLLATGRFRIDGGRT